MTKKVYNNPADVKKSVDIRRLLCYHPFVKSKQSMSLAVCQRMSGSYFKTVRSYFMYMQLLLTAYFFVFIHYIGEV